MKVIYAIWFWTYFFIVTVVMFLTAFVARLFELGRPKYEKKLIHRVACLWGRLLIIGFPIWRLRVEGEEYLPTDKQSYVIVANHLSSGDIFTLCCTNMQFRWLAKEVLFKLPMIGHGMRWAGYVPVNRGNKSSHEAAMRTSREWLNHNVSMLFFPEGTRSRTGELGAFKSGAFRLAEEAQKPVLPIALSGTYTMLRKVLPQPSNIVVHIFPPMQREATETLDHFIQRVRDVIATKAKP